MGEARNRGTFEERRMRSASVLINYANLVIYRSKDRFANAKDWEVVLPFDVPKRLRHPDRIRDLLKPDMLAQIVGDPEKWWYRAERLNLPREIAEAQERARAAANDPEPAESVPAVAAVADVAGEAPPDAAIT